MTKTLILAGGCFWCVESDMKKARGVVSVVSGYSGGDTSMPTYEDHEGHKEVILVEYDSTETTYKKLLQYFIDHIDPTDSGGQFADRGESYRSAIFYENSEEKSIAEGVIDELNKSGIYEIPSQIEILPRKPFYKAEEYHQNYAQKNETYYGLYRLQSGREEFVQNTCALRDEKKVLWSE